jgi:hypothetical protein
MGRDPIQQRRVEIDREMRAANRRWLRSDRGNNEHRRTYHRLKRELADLGVQPSEHREQER